MCFNFCFCFFTWYSHRNYEFCNRKNKKFKETLDSRHIYRDGLDKACFQHDIAYGDFVDLPVKTVTEKVLREKAFNICKIPKNDVL